jgi:hypothetical protein
LDGEMVEGSACSNASSTSCSHLPITHKDGIFVCKLGNDSIVQEYFTGLDGKICKYNSNLSVFE